MEALIAGTRWGQSVSLGVIMTVFYVLLLPAGGAVWPGRVLTGCVCGVIAAVLMRMTTGRNVRPVDGELRALPFTDRRIAVRASRGGPAPTDPAVHQVALHLALRNQVLVDQQGLGGLLFIGAFVAAIAVLGYTVTPWYWLLGVFFAYAVSKHFWTARHATERVDRLIAPYDEHPVR